MTDKQLYLQFIQNIIDRLARNSFLIKGWNITILTALLAIFIKSDNDKTIYIVFLPIIMFWILDSFYLFQERIFRRLYNDTISESTENTVLYSMNLDKYKDISSYLKAFFSTTLMLFYSSNLLVILIIIFIC